MKKQRKNSSFVNFGSILIGAGIFVCLLEISYGLPIIALGLLMCIVGIILERLDTIISLLEEIAENKGEQASVNKG